MNYTPAQYAETKEFQIFVFAKYRKILAFVFSYAFMFTPHSVVAETMCFERSLSNAGSTSVTEFYDGTKTRTDQVMRHESKGDLIVIETHSTIADQTDSDAYLVREVLTIDKIQKTVTREITGINGFKQTIVRFEPFEYDFGHCLQRGVPRRFEMFTQVLGVSVELFVERTYRENQTGLSVGPKNQFVVDEKTFMTMPDGSVDIVGLNKKIYHNEDRLVRAWIKK